VSGEGIQYEEWLAECDRLEENDEGLTVKELMALMNLSKSATTIRVRAGLATGKYAKGWARKKDISGRVNIVPVYRVVDQPKERKRRKSK